MRTPNRSLKRHPVLVAGVVIVAVSMVIAAAFRFGIIDLGTAGGRSAITGPRTFTAGSVHLPDAIEMAGDYLISMLGNDGQFIYRINLNPEHQPAPRYNMLRHAGAMYSLNQLYELRQDESTRDALLSAADWLLRVGVAGVGDHDSLRAVWTHAQVVNQNKEPQAKLGGAGLALIALSPIHQMDPQLVPLETLRGLGRFILFMQKENGSFYSKYFADHGRDDSWTSLYYPGEAALGLLYLYEVDPDPRWLRGAADALQYLALIRAPQPVTDPDHWALIATEKLLAHYGDDPTLPPSWLYVNHAVQIVQSMLAGSQTRGLPRESPYRGGFQADGRTTPTATRLEGMIAALPILPEEKRDLRAQVGRAIHDGTAFLLRAMVKDGSSAGAMPRALTPIGPEHPAYDEDYNRRATEVRIDYVQHALSAFIGYQRLSDEPLVIIL